MKRSKHSLSHYKLFTCSMGELIPIALYEVLPGDSVQQSSSVLLRCSPLLAPVMHPVSVRIHHWFVPNRLVWDQWEDFITGGPDGLGVAAGPPRFPGGTGVQGGLWDYFGVPPSRQTSASAGISRLPTRAYNLIYNEFYRDADLVPEAQEDDVNLKKVAWEKDYFTSARPWPQKGPDITLPLGVAAPVRGIGLETLNGGAPTPANAVFQETQGARAYPKGTYVNTVQPSREAIEVDPATGLPMIFADLTNATATNINDVRKAFALQRYQEARAQYGSRYTEYLRYLGIRSSDARLQRPEYLGGGKATVSFSEVLQTGPGSDTDESVVGELKGHGIAALRTRRYRRFFEEHGYVMSLMSVRPRAMYMDGLHRMWYRQTKEDFWQRELELIGQQEVMKGEVYLTDVVGGAGNLDTWGWQNRYDEYRHHPSGVAGDFRTTLNFWHMAREFTGGVPALNQAFVECDPTKRINAVQTEDTLWCMANHSIQARRLVGKKTVGRII